MGSNCIYTGYVRILDMEGIVLFNDELNTFYLWLCGVRHMVKDHSDSERGNPLLPHRLLFPISSKGSFLYASSHRQDNTHHVLCYTTCGALAGTRNSSMGPPWRIDPTTHRTMSSILDMVQNILCVNTFGFTTVKITIHLLRYLRFSKFVNDFCN